MPFQVALVQARPVLGDVKTNLAHVVSTLTRESTVDLVVYPEMFLSGYALRDSWAQAAITPDASDPVVRELIDTCRATGRSVVVGAPTKGRVRGVLHNSLLLVTPAGLAGVYNKVYLPTFSVFEEDTYFMEGDSLPVFSVKLNGEDVRIGLCICYDLFFPEVTKTLARNGADVIICASASPTPSRANFEAVFPARALETTCHLLYTNLVGAQDAAIFWGGAQAWSPRGFSIAKAPYDDEHILHLEVDLADVEEARRRRPVLRDTRPEVLRMLLDAGRDA